MFVSSNLLRDVLPYFQRKLKSIYDEREAESIFLWVCETWFGLKKSEVLNGDKRLTESELLEFRDVVNRLQEHEPIQYILGETEFYGLKFKVDRRVLIPRPETEELVDLIIKKHLSHDHLKILDIGTGSGCIPISLKLNLKNSTVSAIDISEDALDLAKQNASKNHADIDFQKVNILSESEKITGTFDIIVSNPPYIPEADKVAMHKNVLEHEPGLALFVSNEDPIIFYRAILDFATRHLNEKGTVWFELHPDFASAVLVYGQALNFTTAEILKDLSGKDRFAVFSR